MSLYDEPRTRPVSCASCEAEADLMCSSGDAWDVVGRRWYCGDCAKEQREETMPYVVVVGGVDEYLFETERWASVVAAFLSSRHGRAEVWRGESFVAAYAQGRRVDGGAS